MKHDTPPYSGPVETKSNPCLLLACFFSWLRILGWWIKLARGAAAAGPPQLGSAGAVNRLPGSERPNLSPLVAVFPERVRPLGPVCPFPWGGGGYKGDGPLSHPGGAEFGPRKPHWLSDRCTSNLGRVTPRSKKKKKKEKKKWAWSAVFFTPVALTRVSCTIRVHPLFCYRGLL